MSTAPTDQALRPAIKFIAALGQGNGGFSVHDITRLKDAIHGNDNALNPDEKRRLMEIICELEELGVIGHKLERYAIDLMEKTSSLWETFISSGALRELQ